MLPDDPRHGTKRGYRLHREHDEEACGSCAEAWYRYNKRATYLRLTGQSLRVDALGTHRRIRALMAIGYGLPTLADELGIATGNLSYKLQQPYVARATHNAVADLFERLAMLPPPTGWIAQRTRNIALRRGWPPPLAYDDIDDINEQPKHNVRGTKDATELQDRLDMAVVWRLVDDGARVRKLSGAEAREAWRILVGRGLSTHEIEKRYGLNSDRYGERVA